MNKRRLTKPLAEEFVRQIFFKTNPIKPHEARIIGDILQTKQSQHGWRFASHAYCGGCKRELAVLDLFLGSLARHSPAFIHDYLYGGGKVEGDVAFDDGQLPIIQVFKHPISIPCIGCGYINISGGIGEVAAGCDYYTYVRPKADRPVISVSEACYDRTIAASSEALGVASRALRKGAKRSPSVKGGP